MRSQPASFDREMMANALSMARRGLGRTAPNPSVGAVIADARTGEVIARGVTQPGGRPHAEVEALRRAGDRARGASLYVTLEPCSHHGQTGPCVDAIIASGIARVIAAIEDPDARVAGRGFAKLRAAGIEVVTGVKADEARWLTLGHILRVSAQRPFIQLKLALDAGGKIAPGHDGKPQWVTGPQARAFGHLLRAQADAILVGVNTVIADDPELTCRLPGMADRSPRRVVVDTNLRTPLTATLLRPATTEQHVIIATALAADAPQASALRKAGVELLACLPRGAFGAHVDLAALAMRLADDGITRLLVEGGPSLWRSFADFGLVDEVVLFMANATRSGSDPAGLTPGSPAPKCPESVGISRGIRPAGSDPVEIERDGERGLESQRALAALAAHLGELPLRVTERRNLGPDTLWRMIVRRAD